MFNQHRTFGIELELNRPRNVTMDDLAHRISLAGVECVVDSYSHRVSTRWRIVTDGSLDDATGCEIVSPILHGDEGLRQARIVADACLMAGCKVDVKCGFHVHVGVGDCTVKQIANVAICYLWFETFFDHIMPRSRRASHNQFIRSNRSKFGGYGTEALNAGIASIKNSLLVTANLTKRAQMVNLAQVVTGGYSVEDNRSGARYYKLNLLPCLAYKTVEFRQHSGTIEADKIVHWIKLCVAFVDKAISSKPRPRTVTREWSAAQEMNLLFNMFEIEADTRAFYAARRKELAKAESVVTRAAADGSLRSQLIARINRAIEFYRNRASDTNASYRSRSLARHRSYRLESLPRNVEHATTPEALIQVSEQITSQRLIPASIR